MNLSRRSNPSPQTDERRPRDQGFSLLEVVVTLGIVSVVMLGALTLIDSGGQLTRTQGDIAELQNNQRVAQQEMIRMLGMVGIGGLPETIDPALGGDSTTGVFPDGLAVAVTNDVPVNTHIGDLTSPLIVDGSDVLTLRGVFSTPVYFVEPQLALSLDSDGKMSVVVQTTAEVGVTQNLESLRKALIAAKAATPARPEAFIVRDRFNPGAFAVLEMDPVATNPGETGDPSLTIGLVLSSNDLDQTFADEYGRMALGTTLLQGSGGTLVSLPEGGITVQLPRVVGSIGLLEEYRFFVRQEWDVAGDPASRPKAVLSRARFYPGTSTMHPDGTIDVSDGVLDLQIALGVDLPPRDGRVADGFDLTGAAVDADKDEVLYNHPDDDAGLTPPPGTRTWATLDAQVVFARINTVVQAARPDRGFEGRDLGTIEDHDLSTSIFNIESNLKTRKRHLQTVVRLRNLS